MNFLKILFYSLAFAYYSSTVTIAQSYIPQQIVVANDTLAESNYGTSISTTENFAVIGSPFNNANGLANSGAAYLYSIDNSGQWEYLQKLTASDAEEDDQFGHDVSINGDYLIVGAIGEKHGTDQLAGAAYIFEKDITGSWVEVTKLTAPNRFKYNKYGHVVTIYDSLAFVGAPYKGSDSHAGKMICYKREMNGNWTTYQTLYSSDSTAGDFFGYSIDIQDSNLVIGATRNSTDSNGANQINYAGAAYVFKSNGTNWVQTSKLVASDREYESYFGWAVSINDSNIVVGSPGRSLDNTVNTKFTGAAYTFKQNSNGNWVGSQKLTGSNLSSSYKDFGAAIDINNDQILIGAQLGSAVYLFENDGTGNWNETEIISDTVNTIFYGYDVILTDQYFAVGSPWNNVKDHSGADINNAGSVFLYRFEELVSNTEKQVFEELKVYPNPSTANTINLIFGSKGNRSIQLTNIQGQVMYNVYEEFSQQCRLTLPEMAGVYILRVVDNNNNSIKTVKVIKN